MFSRHSGGNGHAGLRAGPRTPPLQGTPFAPGTPDLLDRIGFDPVLEAEGLRRLALLDIEGCRSRLGRLVADLRLDPTDGNGREVAALLLDLLQQVGRAAYGGSPEDPAWREARLALGAEFASTATAQEAARAFLPALNRLLGRLGTDRSGVVDRARRFIDGNFDERIVLSSVARGLHVSPGHLCRLFRSEMGVTLTSYVQGKRVERARSLLARGDQTMSEIAFTVGYRHYRDFYRNFVRIEGASPRAVRRRLREVG